MASGRRVARAEGPSCRAGIDLAFCEGGGLMQPLEAGGWGGGGAGAGRGRGEGTSVYFLANSGILQHLLCQADQFLCFQVF